MNKQNIVVIGCCGKMGQTVCKFLLSQDKYNIVGAIDVINIGKDIGDFLGLEPNGIVISNNLKEVLTTQNVDVAIDFTTPSTVFNDALICINSKTPIIIGTTGLKDKQQADLGKIAEEKETGIIIVPNFAIGAILMMDFAQKAAKYMKYAEIIELHHNQKIDKPSGTSLKTREAMLKVQNINPNEATNEQIPIHSVRLPGLVAHQEVILGDIGQTLTIRHDSLSRESFMPGIAIALEQIKNLKSLQLGIKL